MNNSTEPRKLSYNCEDRLPFGRHMQPPLALFSRNMQLPMCPILLHLCHYCQDMTGKKNAFETNGGRWYFTLQMCPRCFEFNRASQNAGNRVLERYSKLASEIQREETSQTRKHTTQETTEYQTYEPYPSF